jgi:hypothetical protein
VNRLAQASFSAKNKNRKPITKMTSMKLKEYITIVMIAVLFFGVVQTAFAQDIVAGVASGNEFTYNVTGTYPINDPSLDIPQEIIDANATDYFKVTIVNVAGPEIELKWFWRFTNGTELSGDGSVNIETTGYVGPFWTIVSANLTAGEQIHPHFGPDQSYFNETGGLTYTNYTRETNRLQLQFAYQNNVTGAIKVENTDTYFDKQTGILIQLYDETNYQNPTYTTVLSWSLIVQNVWDSSSPGSFPPEPFFSLPVIVAIAVVVAIVVAILGILVFNKRKAAKRKQLLRQK